MLAAKRKRSTRTARAAIEPRCAVCDFATSHHDPARRIVEHSGIKYAVCGVCRKTYSHAPSQLAAFGTSQRFVRKDEIEYAAGFDRQQFPKVYKMLLLVKERRTKKKKEVNWKVDETTKKMLRLPGRIAAIMRQTYAVLGDDFKIADDIALAKIRDLLEEIDPEIVHKKKRRLS